MVVGRADAETTDYFKIGVKANQRISFDILGRRLGSTSIRRSRFSMRLPAANCPAGSATSPRLADRCPADLHVQEPGEVLIAVRDVSYRGGADFHYRLRIGDFPCATTPLPLAAKRGSKVAVRFSGPTVDGVPPSSCRCRPIPW